MQGVIFTETLRRSLGALLYWGLGLGLMACLSAWLVPLFDAMQLVEMLENLLPVLRGASFRAAAGRTTAAAGSRSRAQAARRGSARARDPPERRSARRPVPDRDRAADHVRGDH